MLTLTPTLLAHQRAARRIPALSVSAQPLRFNIPVLRPTKDVDGAEPEVPHGSVYSSAGTHIHVRNDAGAIKVRRDFGPWSASIATVASGSHLAITSVPGELVIAVADGTALKTIHSTDDGATWGAATTRVTEGSAISRAAIGGRQSNGNLCAFYILGTTTTLKRLRRSAGAWEGTGTTWTKTATPATLTGLAAIHNSGDYHLIVTGTQATTTHPRVWAFVMGDGFTATNTWAGPVDVLGADAASTQSFSAPHLTLIASSYFATFRQQATATPTIDRLMLTHAVGTSLNDWREPAPIEAASAWGAGLAYKAATLTTRITNTARSWASTAPPDLDLTPRVLSWQASTGPQSHTVRIELDASDGALNPGNTTALQLGNQITTRIGFRSGTAGAAEYGTFTKCVVERLIHSFTSKGHTLIVEAVGPWETMAAWHAPQSSTAPAGKSRGGIFSYLAARAGLAIAQATGGRAPTSAWSNDTPAFAINAGEDGRTALLRLIAPTPDYLIGTDAFLVAGTSASEASTYAYGTTHGIAALTISAEARANWQRLQGSDRFADAVTPAETTAIGPRFRQLRDVSATTDALVTAEAAAALRRHTMAPSAPGKLTAPLNAGQELLDVVDVTAPELGLTAALYRVVGLGVRYATGAAPVFDSILELGPR